MSEKKFLTPLEVAEELGYHRQTVIRWLLSGKLKGYNFAGTWRISAEEFERFKAEAATSVPADDAGEGDA